jgi:YHS domain-containing protein
MFNLMLTLALAVTPGAKPAVNAVCPVQGLKVTEKSKTVVVRGQEYRICCPGDCDAKLEKDPDKYLHKDGTPRNAAKTEKKPASGHGDHRH